jgi:hypothetical protein
MPDFYLDSTLAADLAAALARKDEINALQAALTTEEAAVDEKIEEIQAVQAYIADDFPPVDSVAAPATFTATAGSLEVVLAWGAVSGATFTVQRSDDLNDWSTPTTVYSGTGTGYTNTGLSAGQPYFFRVRATKTGFNPSDWLYDTATPTA